MRLKRSMRWRILLSAWFIASLTAAVAAYFQYQRDERRFRIDYTEEMLENRSAMNLRMREMGINLEPPPLIDDAWQQYNVVLCSPEGEMIWFENLRDQFDPQWFCHRMALGKFSSSLAEPLRTPGGQTFFTHVFRTLYQENPAMVIVIRNASEYRVRIEQRRLRILFMLTVFANLVGALLWISFRWSMRPLNKLTEELTAIRANRSSRMASEYPLELQPVVDAINQLLAQNEERSERYKHSLNDLAHSLKTRLAALYALTQPEQVTTETKATVQDQINQMDQMVQYQLKRAAMGRQGLRTQQTALDPVISRLVTMLHKVYSNKQITVVRDGTDNSHFPGSEDDLMELLGNLLENSFRFAQSQIEIGAQQAAGTFRLWVADDGQGIPEDKRLSVLQRGVRADRMHPGQGIGLAVCCDIAESYGGRIDVGSSRFQGAQITVILPMHSGQA